MSHINTYSGALRTIVDSCKSEIETLRFAKHLERQLAVSQRINEGLNERIDRILMEKADLEKELDAWKLSRSDDSGISSAPGTPERKAPEIPARPSRMTLKVLEELQEKLKLLEEVNKGLNVRIDKNEEEKRTLKTENSGLKAENLQLHAVLGSLQTELSKMRNSRSRALEPVKEETQESPRKLSPPPRVPPRPSKSICRSTSQIPASPNRPSLRETPKRNSKINSTSSFQMHSTMIPMWPPKRFNSLRMSVKASKPKGPLPALAINSKKHVFKLFTPKIDSCDVCGDRMTFQSSRALKCGDCSMKIHKNCHLKASLPCSPRQKNVKMEEKNSIETFCSPSQKSPKIPFPIIQCVVALEKRSLDMEGLYRKPGNETSVKKLYSEFISSRPFPKMDFQAPTTITGCLKRFLINLKDPLIPLYKQNSFLKAARNNNQEALTKAVIGLQDAERDTLAYLCHHLQKVVENENNKMTLESVSKCLAPSVVAISPHKKIKEAHEDVIVILEKLIRLPKEFWIKFLGDAGSI
ncbi:hypothetical protein L596_025457 [Steinernema carpocapsae]|uniref:Rho-GAP domain-containing protein n=1 Tax=Steinernema carpocapsae TaxID=34508 RepID=A0A4U5M8N8_STECR|nr:hypothetical protein L596_025457 [Steinernema carpocapsae]